MNKSDRNTQLQETIVYIIVWTFVAISLAFEGHRSKILSKDLENFKLQEDLNT